jgi:hypothetical protein
MHVDSCFLSRKEEEAHAFGAENRWAHVITIPRHSGSSGMGSRAHNSGNSLGVRSLIRGRGDLLSQVFLVLEIDH